MPRKQRSPKTRLNQPLSPAWMFTLMTGELTGATTDSWGLSGWAQQAYDGLPVEDGYSYDAKGDELWSLHGDALLAEALEFDFTPYWATNRDPTGPGFERWRAEFLEAHRRTPIAPTTIHDSGHGEARYDH